MAYAMLLNAALSPLVRVVRKRKRGEKEEEKRTKATRLKVNVIHLCWWVGKFSSRNERYEDVN